MNSVLVTGCSSGIGLCIAEGLKAAGYRVFATARKQDDVDNLKSKGFDATQLDLTDSESIHAAVDWLLNCIDGKIFGLVNNAAYGLTGAIEDLNREVIQQQFETNVIGTQELTNLLIPVMRRQGEGRIIQISSMLGFVTMKFRGAYCATKYALESLSDAMRYELSGTGIYISLIEPGPITSEFRTNALSNFNSNIDKTQSAYKKEYEKIEREMNAAEYTIP
ncbi:MAG: SDR family NAD(P)-dependent oxidoreductase, partial [Pseudomonadota bacterium]